MRIRTPVPLGLLLSALTSLALLFLSPSAEAAPLWVGPSNVFVSPYSTAADDVAMNSAGETAVAWESHSALQIGIKDGAEGLWHKSRRFPAGGRGAQVAIDRKGDVIAVWEHWEGESLSLLSSFRPAGGNWRAPLPLSGNLGEGQAEWDLVMNPRGDAALTWIQAHREPFFESFIEAYSAFARVMPAGSGDWGQAVKLSATGYVTDSDIALDGRGDVLAAWRESARPGPATVQAAFGSASDSGGNWQAPVTLSAGGTDISEQVQAAMGARGDAAVAWTTPSRCGPVVGTILPAGGGWSAPQEISPSGECAVQPKLTVDSHGHVLAVWDGIKRVSSLQVSSTSTAAGRWQQPTRLAIIGPVPNTPCRDLCPGPPLAYAQLTIGPDDTAAITWSKSSSPTLREREVHAALLFPGATKWQQSPSLSLASNAYGPPPVIPMVAIGSRKHAIVVWSANGLVQEDELRDQPLLRNAGLTRTRFPVVGGKGSPVSRSGTRIRFAISAPARLRVTIFRSLPGIRPDLQCVPVPAELQKKNTRRCTRKRLIGVFSNSLQPRGKDNLRFDGSLGNRRLKLGTYTAVLTASRGKSQSESVALPFKIRPPRR
jgi:hypothetical protein